MLALRWHDIDFDRSTITIRRSLAEVGWDLQFTDVKTRTARRTINVSRQALDALRRHREPAEEAAADSGTCLTRRAWCSPGPTAGRSTPSTSPAPSTGSSPSTACPASASTTSATPTLLLRAGVPVKVVSERLGHASPGFTLNVYQHVLPGMQAEAAEVFERLLDAEIS